MARRPAHLTLLHANTSVFPIHSNQPINQPNAPITASLLRTPLSPTTPVTPIKPPLELHLRTILPTTPLSSKILQNAPTGPYPWIWRCHLCHSVYRLGVTRRCLEDGHLFCSLPNPPETPISSEGETENPFLSSEELIKRKEKTKRAKVNKERRKLKRKRHNRGCSAEFDYTGWSNYNIWRRKVALFHKDRTSISSSRVQISDFNPALDLFSDTYRTAGEEQNCWTDCNFPSECHDIRFERLKNARIAAAKDRHKQERRKSLGMALKEGWEGIKTELARKSQIQHHPHTEQMHLIPSLLAHNSHPFPTLNSSPNVTDTMVKLEHKDQEGEADIASLDLGIDGLVNEGEEVEFEFIEKKRKKSIRKIQQLTGLTLATDFDPAAMISSNASTLGESPPSSPLKQGYGVDEIDEGGLGLKGGEEQSFGVHRSDDEDDEFEDGKKVQGFEMENEFLGDIQDGEESRDRQMDELLRVRSDFLRRFERGEVEEFENEEEAL